MSRIHHLLLVLMTCSTSRASFDIELGERGCYSQDIEGMNDCVRYLALNFHDGCKLAIKEGCAPFITRMTFHHSYAAEGERPGILVVGVPCTNESLGLSTNCEWGSYDNASSLGELFGLYRAHTKSKLEEIQLPFHNLLPSDFFPSENDTSSSSSNETVSEEISNEVSTETPGRRRRRVYDSDWPDNEDVRLNLIDSGEDSLEEEKESASWADVAMEYLKLPEVFNLPHLFGSNFGSDEVTEDSLSSDGGEELEG